MTRGLCPKHYLRWWRHGDASVTLCPRRTEAPDKPVCEVASCERSAGGQGLCRAHSRRKKRSGDAAAERPIGNLRTRRYIQGGYVVVLAPEGHPNATSRGRIFEHRLVMSEVLGRPLTAGETVHHKNGDKLDNRPENLELWSSSHHGGQRVEDIIAHCVATLTRYAPDLLK